MRETMKQHRDLTAISASKKIEDGLEVMKEKDYPEDKFLNEIFSVDEDFSENYDRQFDKEDEE